MGTPSQWHTTRASPTGTWLLQSQTTASSTLSRPATRTRISRVLPVLNRFNVKLLHTERCVHVPLFVVVYVCMCVSVHICVTCALCVVLCVKIYTGIRLTWRGCLLDPIHHRCTDEAQHRSTHAHTHIHTSTHALVHTQQPLTHTRKPLRTQHTKKTHSFTMHGTFSVQQALAHPLPTYTSPPHTHTPTRVKEFVQVGVAAHCQLFSLKVRKHSIVYSTAITFESLIQKMRHA